MNNINKKDDKENQGEKKEKNLDNLIKNFSPFLYQANRVRSQWEVLTDRFLLHRSG